MMHELFKYILALLRSVPFISAYAKPFMAFSDKKSNLFVALHIKS
jgi:hypothetical protein